MPVQVSYIIASWNTRELLLDCVRSLCRCSVGYSYEIIVVDNCSTDGSAGAIREAFPNVTLIINRSNVGFARANNQGLRVANGRYVCLVNSDTVMQDDALAIMLRYLNAHSSIGILGPKLLNPDGSWQRSCKLFPSVWNNLCKTFFFHNLFPTVRFFSDEEMSWYRGRVPMKVDVVAGAFQVITRTCLDRVGFLDERFFFYGEDVDYCWRCRAEGLEVVFLPAAGILHYGGQSSTKNQTIDHIQFYRARVALLLKHYPRRVVRFFILIMAIDNLLRFVATGLRRWESTKYRVYWESFQWLRRIQLGTSS